MQCRSCGSSLPTGAKECPRCQAATPYNIYTSAYTPGTTETSSDLDINPYGDEGGLASPTSTDTVEQLPSPSTPTYSETNIDLGSYQSTPEPIQEKPVTETATPQPIEEKPSPAYAQPTFYNQSTSEPYQPVPAPGYTTGYSPVGSAPGTQTTSTATSLPAITAAPMNRSRSAKARNWFIFLTIGMCILVAGLTLYPLLRGVHPLQGPSGSKVYTEAALIITDLKTVNIDQQTAAVTPATTFKANTLFYIYVGINANRFDFNRYIGYYLVSLYVDGKAIDETQVQRVDPTQPIFIQAAVRETGKVTIEAYWCTTNDCSDQELARFTDFRVTA